MSVSFWGVREDGSSVEGDCAPETACLCAQMDPTWDIYLEKSDRESLARSADTKCPHCQGTGVEPGETSPAQQTFASVNARDLLYLMGLAYAPDNCPLAEIQYNDNEAPSDLYGELPVPEMRRHVMFARATFDSKVGGLVHEEEQIYGSPYEDEDGVIQMRPLRAVVPEKTSDRIKERLEELADFVETVVRQRATAIRWG